MKKGGEGEALSDEDELAFPPILLLFPPLILLHGPYVRFRDWRRRRRKFDDGRGFMEYDSVKAAAAAANHAEWNWNLTAFPKR